MELQKDAKRQPVGVKVENGGGVWLLLIMSQGAQDYATGNTAGETQTSQTMMNDEWTVVAVDTVISTFSEKAIA